MIQSFIFVFFPALIVELIRYYYLPFKKLIKQGGSDLSQDLKSIYKFLVQVVQSYFFNNKSRQLIVKSKQEQKQKEQENLSELEQEILAVKHELKELIEESEKHNNPENYTKYAKMQRQIVQKQKVLQIMIKENDQEKLKKQQEEQEKIQREGVSENVEDKKVQKPQKSEQQQRASNFQINNVRAIVTMSYLFLFYVFPVIILPSFLSINKTLYKSFANQRQLGDFLFGMLGGNIDFRGVQMYFLTFREAYIFSLVISHKIIDTLQPIYV